MESCTTSSRTHFEVLGLGLEGKLRGLQAYKSWKMPCLRSKPTLFFDLQLQKMVCKKWTKVMTFSFLCLRELAIDLAVNLRRPFFSFEYFCALCPWSLALASSIPVLGLERVGPWPRIFLYPWPWLRPRALCLRLHHCYHFFNIHLKG